MFHCITRGGSGRKAGGAGGGGGGPPPPPPPHHLILGKNKKRIVEGRKTGRASNKQPGPPLSSRSGSATDYYNGKFI